MLAPPLLVGSIVLGGLGTGVAATLGSSLVPVGVVAAGVVDDVTESKSDASARRR